MGNTMHAHIFKRKQVGQREEVTIKLFYPDGTPCDLEAMEGDGESAAPASSWVTAYQDAQFDLPSDDYAAIGPELVFTVGESGMAFLHASGQFWTVSGGAGMSVKLDDTEDLAEGTANGFNAAQYSVQFPTVGGSIRADIKTNGKVPPNLPMFAVPGLMLLLTPGEHKVQWWGYNGKAKRLRLAAMPL